jgi:hypothetical protein
MYNKAQLSKDRRLAKEPKKLARPKDKFVIPGAPKVDPNGYWDPANVGRIIEVPLNEDSRSITMSYPDGTPLDQPLIGIGTDTGMMQYMMPGQDYIFPNDSSVIEHPIMEEGGTIMDLDEDQIEAYKAGGYIIEDLPQQDNGGVYSKDIQYPNKRNPANSFTVTDPRSMQYGGQYLDLTDEEIDQYRKGGYVVEELPQAQKGKTVKPYVTSDPYEFKLREAAYNDSLWLYKNNLKTPAKHDPEKFENILTGSESKSYPYTSKVISSSKPYSKHAKPTLEWKGGYDPQNPLQYYSSPAIKAGQNKSPFFIPGVPANRPIKYEHRESRWKPHKVTGTNNQFYLPWEDRRDDDVMNTMDYARFKKPVQPVVFKSKTGSKNTSTSNKSYNEKDPIYLSDTNDSRIGWYTEAGNQFLYKKPTQAITVQSKPEVGKLETKKLPQIEAPDIIPSNYNYTPQEPETIRTASRSQTVMEPDPNNPGKFKVKELRQVPYSANFPGEGWLPMNAPQVMYYNPTTGEETEERFQDGELTQAQNGITIFDPDQYTYRKGMYDDSLSLYNAYQFQKKTINPIPIMRDYVDDYNKTYKDYPELLDKGQPAKITVEDMIKKRNTNFNKNLPKFGHKDYLDTKKNPSGGFDPMHKPSGDYKIYDYNKNLKFNYPVALGKHSSPDIWHSKINPSGSYFDGVAYSPKYKKPVQAIYKPGEDQEKGKQIQVGTEEITTRNPDGTISTVTTPIYETLPQLQPKSLKPVEQSFNAPKEVVSSTPTSLKKYTPTKTAYRSQTIMEQDPDRPGEYRMKESRQVPYATTKMYKQGDVWEDEYAPRVLWIDDEGNEVDEDPTKNSFKDGGLAKAQLGLIKSPFNLPADVKHPMEVSPNKPTVKRTGRTYDALTDVKPAVAESTTPKNLPAKNKSIDEAMTLKVAERDATIKAVQEAPLLTEDQKNEILMSPQKLDEYSYLTRLQGPDTIKESIPYSVRERAWDIATNPFDAFEYAVRTGDVSNMPRNYNQMRMAGIDPSAGGGANAVGNALNTTINLFDAGDKVVRNVNEGNYGTAALEAMRFIPGARLNTGASKYLKPSNILPQYKNVYRVEPTSFTKDVSDELSGRWFGPAQDMEFYIKNSKDPNAGTRIIKTRIPTKKWESLSGFNLPENAKAMSAGTGNYKTYMDAANAGELSLGAAKRLSKGVQLPSDVEELTNNPRLINLNEGILPELTVDMIRKSKSKKIFPKIETVEYPAGDLGRQGAFMHYLIESNKAEKPIMGMPRKYFPFEKGGYVANQMTHFQDGGNMDPGNNALELHMFYDKNNFATGGTVEMMTDNEIKKYRDAGYVIIEEPDYE